MVEAKHHSQNVLLTPEQIIEHPLDFIKNGLSNITLQSAGLVLQNSTKKLDWTGLLSMLGGKELAHDLIDITIMLVILIIPLRSLAKRLFRLDKPDKREVVSQLLILGFLSFSFFQSSYMFYYPTFLVFIFFCATIIVGPELSYIKSKAIFILLCANSISITIVCLTWLYSGEILNVSSKWGASMHDSSSQNTGRERFFTSSLQTRANNYEILEAAQQCHLEASYGSRLIVDDSTYFAFKSTKLPVLEQYTWFADPQELPRIEALKNFDGAITNCKRMPKLLSDKSKRSGNFCCISFKDL